MGNGTSSTYIFSVAKNNRVEYEGDMEPLHSDKIRAGHQLARQRGVKIGRPINTRCDDDIARLLAEGLGINRIAMMLRCGAGVVRRVRDAAPTDIAEDGT